MGKHKFKKNVVGIGFKINRLTVVRYLGKDHHGYKNWLCQCECGNYTPAVQSALLQNKKKSCGCAKSLCQIDRDAVDMKGQIWGRLLVLERDYSRPLGNVYWKCLCLCGKYHIASGKDIRRGNTKSCGCLIRELSSENIKKYCAQFINKKGINSPRWRHDLSAEERLMRKKRNLIENYNEWVKIIHIKCNRNCQKCSSNKRLEAHHINNFADNILMATDPENGIILCHECHVLFHKIYGKKKNNKEQLLEFLSSIPTRPLSEAQ